MGGGFLIVPALVLLAGVTMTSAVGTSLAVITLNSFSGFGKYLGVLEHEGLALDWRILLTVAAVGVVGSFAGQKLGQSLPQATLRRLFGALLVVMGLFIAADVAAQLLHPGQDVRTTPLRGTRHPTVSAVTGAPAPSNAARCSGIGVRSISISNGCSRVRHGRASTRSMNAAVSGHRATSTL